MSAEEFFRFLRGIWLFLVREPVLLILVLAWIAGGLGKIVKTLADAARKRRAADAAGAPPPLESAQATMEELARSQERDRVAARREQEVGEATARRRQQRRADTEVRSARPVAEPVAPVVSEEVRRERVAAANALTKRNREATVKIGEGGGTASAAQARLVAAAFDLGDLRRAILTSEILQPPLALRDPQP